MILDPCPFCGHAQPELDGEDEHSRVRCLGCGAQGKMIFISDYLVQAGGDEDAAAELADVAAINAWNNRATPDYHYEEGAVRWFRWPEGGGDVRGHRCEDGWSAVAMKLDDHPITGEPLVDPGWWMKETKDFS